MREPGISAKELERWAGILLDHSLGGITPEDRVMIKGERIVWPLLEVLERRVIEAGALPDLFLVPPNNDRGRIWSTAMIRHGTPGQIQAIPGWNRARYEAATKFVEVLGAEDPRAFELPPRQRATLMSADFPYALMRNAVPWVITLYPTPAGAAVEGMELAELTRLLVRASTADMEAVSRQGRPLVPLFEAAREIAVVTSHPDGRELTLRMDISRSIPDLCTGQVNIPDGELATTPDARSPEGEIFLDLPGRYDGGDVQGVYFRLQGGRITDFHARQGGPILEAILATDPGARRLGEVALGLNTGIRRTLKDPLLLEKVGGTLHIAVGDGYPEYLEEDPASPEGRARLRELEEAGILNRSAQHVDLVADFRPGGCGRRVLLDDTVLAVRDGAWVVV